MKKLCINASNLHVGGGVQVAVSFLYELSLMSRIDVLPIHVVVSTMVANGLARLNVDTTVFGHYEILNTYGIKAFYSRFNDRVKKYDVVFTVFGPNYFRVKAKTEIVGFAQPWVLNFDNPISKKMSFLNRNILRAKFFLQWIFFLRADHYVVELGHVKKGLMEVKGVDGSKISVVNNTVSSLYSDKSKWKSICIEKGEEEISLGLITRDYPHKNIKILPYVAEILETKHNLKVRFYVTLNELEWATKDEFFRKYVSTAGSLSPDQCPSFYTQIDGVVFPSLLECFSATPLEAMVMGKPLFASDRYFVSDVCRNHAVYFEPLDAEDVVLKIANYFKEAIDRSDQLQQAKQHALNFSNAKGRAEQYLKIIQHYLKG